MCLYYYVFISFKYSLVIYLPFSLTHPFTYFRTLNELDKVNYLLKADNDNTCKIVGKYVHLEFKKGKRFLTISF